jgi:hypothetical protein
MRPSAAQERILRELAEPNKNPENEWRCPLKWNRSLYVLRELGMAECIQNPDVWKITERGRAFLKEKGDEAEKLSGQGDEAKG